MPYDPNQPRVPAGVPEGGQWTEEQLRTIEIAARRAAGVSAPMTFEEWSKKAFTKVLPKEGFIAAQYENYLKDWRPEEKDIPKEKVKDLSNMKVETYGDIKTKVNNFIERENQNGRQYSEYGLRFEDKKRDIGEKIGYSMHNPDRSDERDFPEYGTTDYYRLQKLGGASAWRIDMSQDDDYWKNSIMSSYDKDTDKISIGGHLYIIGGDFNVTHSDADPNEIVIKDAVVVRVIF